jgi:DtxR family transcriptional regulator, Mn-dependent transcriptional regulator
MTEDPVLSSIPVGISITPAMQDYLKAVYRLGEIAPVTTQRLAEELGVAPPSATNMAKRLHEQGLLNHAPYHGVTLTPMGRQAALDVVRRHRLLETYLAEAVGLGWDEVHDEAERLEHHLSDRLEARLDSLLGFPETDPHGDPIPRAGADLAPGPTLLQTPAGAEGTVSRVSDRDPEQLRYLRELGIVPGVRVAVIEHLPFEGPVRIRVLANGGDGQEHVLGRVLAGVVRLAS